MAFDVGAVYGTLKLNTSDWDKAINKAKSDAKSFEGAILRNEDKLKKFAVALGVAGAAITATGVKLFMMASEAVESENMFEVSMKGMANEARAWSNQLAKSLGLNQYEIRRTVGTLNVMIRSMGLSKEAAFEMSKSVVLLANDMASFFNISSDEAFEKIRSGLIGMGRPLQELGIIVNDTTVQQYALTQGIIKQGEELTEQQKVLVRYQLILEATKDAQGDLARTMDSTANQMRRAGDLAQQLGVSLGTSLIPAATNFFGILNKILTGLIDLTEKFPQATAVVVTFTVSLGALLVVAAAVLAILPGLAAAAAAAGVTMGVFAGSMAVAFLGVAAAVTAAVLAFQNWDTVKAVFFSFAEGINKALAFMVNKLADFYNMLSKIPGVGRLYRGVADDLRNLANEFRINAKVSSDAAVNSIEDANKKSIQFNKDLLASNSELKQDITNMWQGATEEATKSFYKMNVEKENWFQKMKSTFNVMEEIGKRTFNNIADQFSNLFFNVMTGEIHSLEQVFADFGESVIRMIADIMAQWLAMKIMTGIFGAFGGGGFSFGGVLSSGTSLSSQVGAFGGGIASFDTGTDYVPYDMIAKVHKGEEILRPEEAGKGRGIELTIHNMITPEAVAQAMATKEGESTIVNVIDRNTSRGGAIRRSIKGA